MTPLEKLEQAIQTFVDETAELDPERSPGLVVDFFVAFGYTRIDSEGEQPFTRAYAASDNPAGSFGVAVLCLADAKHDLGVDQT